MEEIIIKPGEVCPVSGAYGLYFEGSDLDSFTLDVEDFEKGKLMRGINCTEVLWRLLPNDD